MAAQKKKAKVVQADWVREANRLLDRLFKDPVFTELLASDPQYFGSRTIEFSKLMMRKYDARVTAIHRKLLKEKKK